MSNNKQQTAVDWIEQQMMEGNLSLKEILIQAKEMEKQKIAKAFDDGDYNYHYSRKTGNDFENGEEYFKELYGGNNHLCCTPEGQIKRYVNCIGCDRKPLIVGGNK